MTADVDYQEMLEETDVELDGPVPDEVPRTRATTTTGRERERDRDYRRAIEDLREQKRLRSLLSDFDLDDDDL